MSFEEANPMTSPFNSPFAQKVYDTKKSGSELDNQSDASDITPVSVIPELKKRRKKVDVSLLTAEQWRRCEKTKVQRAHKYMKKRLKNSSIS